MKRVYSVCQVNRYVKNMFIQDYFLRNIYIKGEVSNCKYHTSGHIYFSLKDESSVISCIMFASQRNSLAFQMRDGDQVTAGGSLEVYERDGRYQLYVKEIEQQGFGDLYERFLYLKKELEDMGMFAPEYKQTIPRFIKKLGVVTAPTGAAIQDIRNICRRRNPGLQIILYPALVQGEGAAASIVKGIEMLDQSDVDVIIVGRGGGSMEDLWAFNEECVARAIFHCETPVISAVGHETDVTITDYVADLRAPTPSAAAELAVDDYRSVMEAVNSYTERMHRAMWGKYDLMCSRMEQYFTRMQYLSPENRLRENQQRFLILEEQLTAAMDHKMKECRMRLQVYLEKFAGLSPLKKLNQGFSHAVNADGSTIYSVSQTSPGEKLFITVTDGTIETEVCSIRKEEHVNG